LASEFLPGVTTNLMVFTIAAPSEAAWDRFDQLVKLKLNVGSADLRIAALALDINATVVTANVRDFARVPGLSWVDWSV
jgi:tRNA(fMet)-specific endonuclease VapC